MNHSAQIACVFKGDAVKKQHDDRTDAVEVEGVETLSVFRDIVVQAPLSIWASLGADDGYKIVAWNGGAEAIYGHSREEAIGKNYLDLFISDEEREQSAADCDEIIGEGRVFENFLATDEASDGSVRVMLTNCFRVMDPITGKYIQVEVALDVSDEGLFSEEERRHRELRELAFAKKQLRRDLQAGTEINDLRLKITRLSRQLHEAGKVLSYIERSSLKVDDFTRDEINRLVQSISRNIG